ncbi:hypothetical protein GSI_03066 [Ganoderma sinense ZZ0214-1]|uniref:Uncharacterized protein n=1 Tax=Ganoderma sinense ZZ0214-1 TaxID=1077348 RepID=A0A2G8SKJ8_9APHY|nr:hypothetical protein GSI_03066 [Ganoderma sinense ZZ0214-1]
MHNIVDGIPNPTSPGPLINGDAAVGDPARLRVPVLVVNLTRTNARSPRFADGPRRANSSTSSPVHLSHEMARSPSVRAKCSSGEGDLLWLRSLSSGTDTELTKADFVYMVLPLVAYYGAVQGGEGGSALLAEPYQQCKLYRERLRDDSGLWKHVVLGFNQWGTGNAWAGAGMLRVVETTRSSQAVKFVAEWADLTDDGPTRF